MPITQPTQDIAEADDQARIAVRVSHAAELVDMGQSTLWHDIANGLLPVVRVHGRTRVLVADLNAYLCRHRHDTTA